MKVNSAIYLEHDRYMQRNNRQTHPTAREIYSSSDTNPDQGQRRAHGTTSVIFILKFESRVCFKHKTEKRGVVESILIVLHPSPQLYNHEHLNSWKEHVTITLRFETPLIPTTYRVRLHNLLTPARPVYCLSLLVVWEDETPFSFSSVGKVIFTVEISARHGKNRFTTNVTRPGLAIFPSLGYAWLIMIY